MGGAGPGRLQAQVLQERGRGGGVGRDGHPGRHLHLQRRGHERPLQDMVSLNVRTVNTKVRNRERILKPVEHAKKNVVIFCCVGQRRPQELEDGLPTTFEYRSNSGNDNTWRKQPVETGVEITGGVILRIIVYTCVHMY